MTTTSLTWLQVAASGLLVAVAVIVAAGQRLEVTRDLLIATIRAAAQLAAVGAVLLLLFQHAGAPGALGWVTVMVLIAGQVAGRRGRGVPRAPLLATTAVALGSLVSLATLLLFQILPIRPEAIVPIGGMIVATAMQATGLVLLRLAEDVHKTRPAIEARLSLAMPADQAFAPHRRSAARTALLPRHRLHQSRRPDQPARSHDRTHPRRRRPHDRHPLPDRRHVHAPGLRNRRRRSRKPPRPAHTVRPRSPTTPLERRQCRHPAGFSRPKDGRPQHQPLSPVRGPRSGSHS